MKHKTKNKHKKQRKKKTSYNYKKHGLYFFLSGRDTNSSLVTVLLTKEQFVSAGKLCLSVCTPTCTYIYIIFIFFNDADNQHFFPNTAQHRLVRFHSIQRDRIYLMKPQENSTMNIFFESSTIIARLLRYLLIQTQQHFILRLHDAIEWLQDLHWSVSRGRNSYQKMHITSESRAPDHPPHARKINQLFAFDSMPGQPRRNKKRSTRAQARQPLLSRENKARTLLREHPCVPSFIVVKRYYAEEGYRFQPPTCTRILLLACTETPWRHFHDRI